MPAANPKIQSHAIGTRRFAFISRTFDQHGELPMADQHPKVYTSNNKMTMLSSPSARIVSQVCGSHLRRTNRTHEVRVYSHDGPIGRMKRGYILSQALPGEGLGPLTQTAPTAPTAQ
eukprot:1187921-Prorocentrum_minimum.AAC.1